jgi:hypothetical protein
MGIKKDFFMYGLELLSELAALSAIKMVFSCTILNFFGDELNFSY